MQLETGFPSSHQLMYYVASKSRLKLAARAVLSVDAGLLVYHDAGKFDSCSGTTPPHHNRLSALFAGPPGWAGARRELLDFMVQGEINRGRHTDHPVGRHSIRTR